MRLRTVGAQARGRGIVKHGQNERRRRRLRQAGGRRGRPGRRGAAQIGRAARVSPGRRRHAVPCPWQARSKGGSADRARCSRRSQARSARGRGSSGALLASHRGIVGMQAQIARRRSARGVALANHARPRASRYGGHSNNSSWASMSKGVAPGCLSSVLALVGVDRQLDHAPGAPAARRVGASVRGALLRMPKAARPAAACKARALPSHGQAGDSGRSAGGLAARRGRGVAGGRWSGGTVACK